MDIDRRSLLSFVAGAGVASVAGCLGIGDDSDEECPELTDEPDYGGWFDNTSNYRRTCDFRDRERITVRVGTQANQAYWGYSPPAIAITPGATVKWEWTGRGGHHDVEENNGVFDSGSPVDSDTETFEVTFEEPGVFKYFCSPHRSPGMKGAVFVALE